MLNNPTDAYEKFEEISTLVKRTHFHYADPKHDHQVNASAAPHKHDELTEAWIKAS